MTTLAGLKSYLTLRAVRDADAYVAHYGADACDYRAIEQDGMLLPVVAIEVIDMLGIGDDDVIPCEGELSEAYRTVYNDRLALQCARWREERRKRASERDEARRRNHVMFFAKKG